MRKTTQAFLMIAVAIVTTTSLLISGFPNFQKTEASSHREAPLISLDATADNTDVYAFVSPDRPNSVTLLANFIPLQEPAGGPNFARFDDNVLYQLRFDNNGDARLDLTIEFRFRTVVGNGNTFLYNTNTIDNISDPDWNVKQFMDVTARIRQGDPNNPTFRCYRSEQICQLRPSILVHGQPRINETNLAEPSISTIPTGAGDIKVFAGQRDEGFYVDLGSTFDLLGERPFKFGTFSSAPNFKRGGCDCRI